MTAVEILRVYYNYYAILSMRSNFVADFVPCLQCHCDRHIRGDDIDKRALD